MSKKILSVVLAIVLVFTVTATAFAASVSYEDKDATYTQSWALGEPKDNGDGTWSVAVKLTANYPVMSFAFQLSNTDATNVTLKSAVVGKDIPNDDTAETFWNATVTVNKAAGRVAINPNPIDDAVPAIDCSTEKEIAVLTYTVADGKSADVAIVNDPKTATNGDGTLVAARSANNNVVSDVDNPIVGQKVDSVGSAKTLGNAVVAKPELVIKDSKVVLNTKITCGGQYTGALMGFSGTAFTNTAVAAYNAALGASNGGSLVYEMSAGSGRNRYGTGSKVKLMDTDGTTVLATYVIIIFGDVDGSGTFTATDASAVVRHVAKTEYIDEATPAYVAASGADGSKRSITISASDRSSIAKHANKTAYIDQAAVAAKYTESADIAS